MISLISLMLCPAATMTMRKDSDDGDNVLGTRSTAETETYDADELSIDSEETRTFDSDNEGVSDYASDV
jgi:hypothetical protein